MSEQADFEGFDGIDLDATYRANPLPIEEQEHLAYQYIKTSTPVNTETLWPSLEEQRRMGRAVAFFKRQNLMVGKKQLTVIGSLARIDAGAGFKVETETPGEEV